MPISFIYDALYFINDCVLFAGPIRQLLKMSQDRSPLISVGSEIFVCPPQIR